MYIYYLDMAPEVWYSDEWRVFRGNCNLTCVKFNESVWMVPGTFNA